MRKILQSLQSRTIIDVCWSFSIICANLNFKYCIYHAFGLLFAINKTQLIETGNTLNHLNPSNRFTTVSTTAKIIESLFLRNSLLLPQINTWKYGYRLQVAAPVDQAHKKRRMYNWKSYFFLSNYAFGKKLNSLWKMRLSTLTARNSRVFLRFMTNCLSLCWLNTF